MENIEKMSRVQKLTFSAMVMALYIVILYFTQSFSFGAYQIRIATSLYALSYLFPFLVLPLGLANFISNMLFGGFGIVDMLGGCIVGIAASSCIVLIRRKKWNRILIAVPIVLVPGLGVATYLSYFLAIPYPLMALNLCIGQIVPAIVGVALVKALERVWRPAGTARVSDSRTVKIEDRGMIYPPAKNYKERSEYEWKIKRRSGRSFSSGQPEGILSDRLCTGDAGDISKQTSGE